MADAVATPSDIEVIVGETRKIQVDFLGVLGASTSVSNPYIVATDLDSREDVTSWAVAAITLTGTIFGFTLLTSGLRAGIDYSFRLTCSVGTGNQTVTVELVVKVIY